jgi:tRNA(Ile)-lysidine synthase
MLGRIHTYIKENQLFSPDDRILVGVSGGVDSIVLLDLLYKAGYSVAIAHCNFKLRSEDSDADEALVDKLALKYNKPIFKTSFNTLEYARGNGISIEMAARELRYRWFETIRSENGYHWICVAHHRDDQIETFFLHLSRGTGLTGLTGMSPVNDKVVRPLLFASRKEIEQYSRDNQLEFREDLSNSNLEYQRNKIRHQILPLMEELNPSFREGLIHTITNLQDSLKIESHEIENAWDNVAEQRGEDFYLSIDRLKELDPLPSYLYHFLKKFQFNSDVVKEIAASLESGSGKKFFSHTYRLVRDRDFLIVREIGTEDQSVYYLDETCRELNSPVRMKISIMEKKYKFEIPDSLRIGCIDLEKIQFPLMIRRWKQGDSFRPLGMKGEKKLSDLFIDLKMSLPDKESAWILANGDEIVWVIGRRLDDRYKVTPKTKNIFRMELL